MVALGVNHERWFYESDGVHSGAAAWILQQVSAAVEP